MTVFMFFYSTRSQS